MPGESEAVTVQPEICVNPNNCDLNHEDIVENRQNGNGMSRKSWRLQLLRLVHEAPKPVPVFCNEPRRFPHPGITNRISTSSWVSDTTCSTDVTESGSASLTALVETKGANASKQVEMKETEGKIAGSSGLAFTSSTLSPQTFDFASSDKGNNADTIIYPFEENRTKVLETCTKASNHDDDNQKEIMWVYPPKHLYSSSSRSSVQNPMVLQGHQQQAYENYGKCGRVPTVSLSIQGDSEYWEKFRYSKDYQSSLMIETICNEVFNLKPSPRYNNLMKLSQRNKSRVKKKNDNRGKEEKSSKLAIECSNNDKDEKGIKVEMPDKQKENTKDKVKTISTARQLHNFETGSNAFSNIVEREKRNNEDEDEGGCGGGNEENKEDKEQDRPFDGFYKEEERKQSYISTTSSVFTATTTSEDVDDENFNEYSRLAGQVERMLMFEGFGSAFHGYLTKRETESLLRNKGQYLIRQVWKEDGFILSFRFNDEVRNYRIICEAAPAINFTKEKTNSSDDNNSPEQNGKYRYYLENRRKCYHSLDELVQEGLLILHLDENAGPYIDLLVELAQFQRTDSLLQTSAAVTSGSRKPSRSASFRATTIESSSSVGNNGPDADGATSNNKSMRNSVETALQFHFFEEEIFEKLSKCQICAHGLWGPSCKGLRCRDCGLAVHESCIGNVKNECHPDLGAIPPFSTDLTTLVKGSCSTTGSYGLPYVLEKCINELEARGIETEGIYRVSGSVEEIESLKNLFEKEKINTDLTSFPDIHSITSLVKFFLRELPDSLITPEVFDQYLKENNAGGEMTITSVENLLHGLPPAHRLTLQYFMAHLKAVTMEKTENKMTAFNLSSILLPSIIGPSNMSFDVLESGAKLLYFLITHANDLKF